MEKLCHRARYSIKGEKPVAVIAALRYLHENKLVGKRLLEVFDEPEHAVQVRKIFINLANQFGRISDPSASWSVITGKNRELQNAIIGFANMDDAFSKLTLEEIGSLHEKYIERLKENTKTALDVKSVEIERGRPLRYSFREADKILGSLKEEIEKAIRKSPSHNHAEIVESFAKLGWETEVALIGQYRCDALKEGVAVEVEAIDKSSVIDTLHRDFFRFLILYRMGKIRVGVIVTRASGGEVNFQKVVNEIELYGDYYEVPLYIVGSHLR